MRKSLYLGITVAGSLVWRKSGPRVGPSLALRGALATASNLAIRRMNP